MLVYGRNVAIEILKKNIKVKKIILQDNFNEESINSLIKKKNLKIFYERKDKMDDLVNAKSQGIILDVEDYQYKSLDKIVNEEASFIVILDHIEDPHNLGAIIRTSEAAGVDAIIMPKNRQALINSTVIKTSAGAITNMDVVLVTNLVNTIKTLKENNFWIVGTALEDSVDYRKIDYTGKIALVIGNEGKGISRLVRESCDFIANIPMVGEINSLNASVASGIMIYEVVRNRK